MGSPGREAGGGERNRRRDREVSAAGFDFPDESQHRLIRWLLSRHNAPVIVLACRDPYELAQFPEVDAYICAVRYRPACARAAVGVLFGEIAPRGRLPVTIPGLYAVGRSAVPS